MKRRSDKRSAIRHAPRIHHFHATPTPTPEPKHRRGLPPCKPPTQVIGLDNVGRRLRLFRPTPHKFIAMKRRSDKQSAIRHSPHIHHCYTTPTSTPEPKHHRRLPHCKPSTAVIGLDNVGRRLRLFRPTLYKSIAIKRRHDPIIDESTFENNNTSVLTRVMAMLSRRSVIKICITRFMF